MSYTSKIVELSETMDKSEISDILADLIAEANPEFGHVQIGKAIAKALKDSGVKFGRGSGGTGWREAIVECFTANPDATEEDLAEAFKSTTLKDPKHYAKYYYKMAKGLAGIEA